LLTLRAIGVGLAVYLTAAAIGIFIDGFLYGYFFPVLWSLDPTHRWLLVPWDFAPSVLAAWVVARTHRSCVEAAILVLIPLGTLIMLPIDGWTFTANIAGLLAGAFIGVYPRLSAANNVLK
jgi:hypothetical protein